MGALTQGILEPKILRCKVHRFTSSIPKFITKNFITRQGQNQYKITRFFNLVTFAHIGNFFDKRFGSLYKAVFAYIIELSHFAYPISYF